MPRKTKRIGKRTAKTARRPARAAARHNAKTKKTPRVRNLGTIRLGLHLDRVAVLNAARKLSHMRPMDHQNSDGTLDLIVSQNHQASAENILGLHDKRALAWEVGRSRGMNPTYEPGFFPIDPSTDKEVAELMADFIATNRDRKAKGLEPLRRMEYGQDAGLDDPTMDAFLRMQRKPNPSGDFEDAKSAGYLGTILKSLDMNGQFYDVMREWPGRSFTLRRHDDGDLTASIRDANQTPIGAEVVVPQDQIADVYHYALHHGTLEGWEPGSGGYEPEGDEEDEYEYEPGELAADRENPQTYFYVRDRDSMSAATKRFASFDPALKMAVKMAQSAHNGVWAINMTHPDPNEDYWTPTYGYAKQDGSFVKTPLRNPESDLPKAHQLGYQLGLADRTADVERPGHTYETFAAEAIRGAGLRTPLAGDGVRTFIRGYEDGLRGRTGNPSPSVYYLVVAAPDPDPLAPLFYEASYGYLTKAKAEEGARKYQAEGYAWVLTQNDKVVAYQGMSSRQATLLGVSTRPGYKLDASDARQYNPADGAATRRAVLKKRDYFIEHEGPFPVTVHVAITGKNTKAFLAGTPLEIIDGPTNGGDVVVRVPGTGYYNWLRKRDLVISGPRRSNPADGAAGADEMYSTFHGSDPTETVVVEEVIVHHGNVAALGDLEELVVVTPRGHKVVLDFTADPPLLCSSSDGKQLLLRGGDMSIDLAAIKMNGSEWVKDVMVLGDVLSVTYRTAKTMDSGKVLSYEHKFTDPEGTKGGDRAYPVLTYDTLNNRLEFAGGTSINLEAGIVG